MKNIKKFIYGILAAILVVPFAIGLSACGDENTYVKTQEELIEAVKKDNAHIKLSNDIELTEGIVFDGVTAVLDLGTNKLFNDSADIWNDETNVWAMITLKNGANVVITADAENTGSIVSKKDDAYAVAVLNGSTCSIKNGTFGGNVHSVYVCDSKYKRDGSKLNYDNLVEKGLHASSLVVEGGYFYVQQKFSTARPDEYVLNLYDMDRTEVEGDEIGLATITVKGGSFAGFNPADNYAEGEHTNFVADGYKVTSKLVEDVTVYTVEKEASK